MSDGGWLKLYRVLIKKPIWKQSTPEQKSILITLLCMVNHEDEEWEWKGKKYVCKPGQKITSLKNIAKECGKGVSIQNIRTAITRFEKVYRFLTNESTKESRLVTILNWELYQSGEINQQSNQQTGNKGVTTNKNDKKYKKNKEIIYTPEFELFYSSHPNPFNKEQSLKNWNNLLKIESVENIMRATENYIQYCKDTETTGIYIVRSTNFVGQHKEYKGYLDYKAGSAKPKPKKPVYANFTQREYSKDEFDSMYENTEKLKNPE